VVSTWIVLLATDFRTADMAKPGLEIRTLKRAGRIVREGEGEFAGSERNARFEGTPWSCRLDLSLVSATVSLKSKQNTASAPSRTPPLMAIEEPRTNPLNCKIHSAQGRYDDGLELRSVSQIEALL